MSIQDIITNFTNRILAGTDVVKSIEADVATIKASVAPAPDTTGLEAALAAHEAELATAKAAAQPA